MGLLDVPMDATDANFQTAVIDRSADVTVVVDLWAPWCGPCRTLGPILEKVIGETDGRAELVKVNVDENPGISQAFQVQSIPAVYALQDGKVVDGFVGALPEPQVRAFVDRLAPPETEADRLVAKGDEASLRAALDLQPDHPEGVVALAEVLVGKGDNDEALALLERLPESPESRRVAALARVGGDEAVPDDFEAKLDALLDRVKGDEDARQEFVDLLELLGPDDPRTAKYRKALTARLF
jgi:putative thioredoxin